MRGGGSSAFTSSGETSTGSASASYSPRTGSITFPVVEVHITNVHAREEWRRQDLVAPATRGQIVGLGPSGYYYAAVWLCSQVADPVLGEYDADAEPVEVSPDDIKVDEAPPPIGGDYEG